MKHHFVGTKSNSYLSLRTISALHAQGPRSNDTIMRWKINKIHWLHVVYWNLPVALHNMLQIKKWSISRKGYIIILKIINKYFDVSVFSIKSKFKCINFLKISLRWHSSTYSRSFRYAWIYYAHFFLIWVKTYLNFDWRFEAECCDEKGRWMRRSPQMAHGPIDGVLHDP